MNLFIKIVLYMKDIISLNNIYHVYNKSISNYRIFSSDVDFERFLIILDYYNNIIHPEKSLSKFLLKNKYDYNRLLYKQKNIVIKLIAYCIMPDHYHLLIKIKNEDMFFQYMNDIGNSYSKYFNTTRDRKGPLWQSSYQTVLVMTNEQLLHLSRYIHLNPVTKYLVDKPERWIYSSYNEYINNKNLLSRYIHEISIQDKCQYKKFVENNIDYQRKISLLKNLKFD